MNNVIKYFYYIQESLYGKNGDGGAVEKLILRHRELRRGVAISCFML